MAFNRFVPSKSIEFLKYGLQFIFVRILVQKIGRKKQEKYYYCVVILQ